MKHTNLPTGKDFALKIQKSQKLKDDFFEKTDIKPGKKLDTTVEKKSNHGNKYWDAFIRDELGQKIYVEYKTSLEESDPQEVIRQIKRMSGYDVRNKDSNKRVLATCDERFEKYRTLFENEGIELFNIPEKHFNQEQKIMNYC